MKETNLDFQSKIFNSNSNQATQAIVERADLLGALAHELRSPISAMVHFAGFVEAKLKKMNLSTKDSKELFDDLSYIQSLGSDSLEIANDILEMRKIAKDGVIRFSVDLSKEVKIEDVVKKSIKLNYSYYLRNGLNIKTKIENDLLVRADEKRLRQVLANLISNAVKYSPKNTTITITANKDVLDNKVNIKVIDQGFGMSKDQLTRVFDKYQTFQNPNSNRVDSFGLGLPLVKEMVELQHGKITINSELGKGTEVLVKF